MSDPTASGGLNWDDILEEQEGADTEFAAIPATTYTVEIESAEARTAQSGNKMINLTCRVQGGPYDQRIVWTNIVFATDNPTAMKFTLRKLKALGVTKEWLARENPSTETIAAQIEGVVAEAEVTQRTWEDELRNDIKSFKALATPSPGSAASEPPAPAATPTPTPDPEPKAPAGPSASEIPLPEADDSEEPF